MKAFGWKSIALCAFAVASSHAQAPNANALSGRWTGFIAQSEANPSAVTVDFKLAADGKVSGNVTGPKITPGDITAGTFDPATGALKFTVVIRAANDANRGGTVSFDGRVSNDSASGKMTLGGENGVFKLAKEKAAKPATRATDDPAAAMRRGFVEVSDWITRAAELVPADKYSYRPTPGVRTFGQLVGHVVDGSAFYCGRGAGRNVQWTETTEKGVTAKAALAQALKKSFQDCVTIYDAPSQFGPLMGQVGHLSLHYGNMITYMRMLGLTPPSS
jgi:hypothetical protein